MLRFSMQEYWSGMPLPSPIQLSVQFGRSVVSDSVRSHRRQPTRLPHPRDSPGKNTGVGCRFLLQSMKVKSESEVTQSCLTLSDHMDCSLPGSSVHGIFQADCKLRAGMRISGGEELEAKWEGCSSEEATFI